MSDDSSWLALGATLAAIALGQALQVNDGFRHPVALRWLVVSLAIVFVVMPWRRSAPLAALEGEPLRAIVLAGVWLQLGQMYSAPLAFGLHRDDVFAALFPIGLAVLAAIAAALMVLSEPRHKWLLVGAAVTIHFAIGAGVLRRSPEALIDVAVFHQQSARALQAGVDPYAITFPNIYGGSDYYGPGVSVGGRLQFGYPYPPEALLFSLPATILAHDHRYAPLVAMELAALLMAFAHPRGFGALGALLYLTSPRLFFVLQMSWTEPVLVLGLAAVVFAACRCSRAVPWLFGAFVGLKQYLFFALPAALMLTGFPSDRRAVVRWWATAAVVPAVTIAPFYLWNPGAFWNSVVTLQGRQPFRTDALSLLAWWAARGHAQPSAAIAFAIAGLASGYAVWRFPRTASGFAATVAMTFLAFFAFNKQAFCNYYMFVVGALCLVLAAGTTLRERS